MLTTEIEHINADAVEEACTQAGLPFEPSPSTLRVIQVGPCGVCCWVLWRGADGRVGASCGVGEMVQGGMGQGGMG